YLAGLVGFKRRTIHRWTLPRLITVPVLLLVVPLVHGLPALAQLAVLAGILTALVGVDGREPSQVRAARDPAAN
ncbi:MAG: low temperature requirement protein A, partial [Kribbellaceae bacterium]|nr:low temperature requirement protein A [Kribbellaceae bacterium]